MKNYLKRTLFVLSFAFLVAFSGIASAAHPYNTYTYTDRDSFSYNENVAGRTGSFDVAFRDTEKGYSYANRGYSHCLGGHYSWRSYGCDRYYDNRPYYPDHASYEGYDRDEAIKQAFKTYQQRSKQEYQLEIRRIALEERRRQSYGHYYGYTAYQYGW